MSTKQSRAKIIGRRGELIVELFFEDLEPAFVAQSTADVPYDYFVGFENLRGGINTFGVEVKATEQPVRGQYQVQTRWYERLSYSNIPILLLIVDVKENRLHYTWSSSEVISENSSEQTITIPVTEIDEEQKKLLRKKFIT
ncbi:MAG: DUF4365 domain-containing protein [Xenococcus sp. (in: cyanobacteria)]